MLTSLLFFVALLLAAQHPEIPAKTFACRVTARFSPHGGVEKLLVEQIDVAKIRIRVAAYGLNNPRVVEALIRAQQRGVNVRVKVDAVQSSLTNQEMAITNLQGVGIDVKVSELSRPMHHKFMVIDGKKLWTGSYNFTTSAENRNRENIVLTSGCLSIPKLFEEEWELIE